MPGVLIEFGRFPKRFLVCVHSLVVQDLFLLASCATSLLSPDLRDFSFSAALLAKELPFKTVAQLAPGKEPVQGLRAFPSALDFHAGGLMKKIYAGGRLIDLLAAGPGAFDEFLDKIAMPNAEAREPCDKLFCFSSRYH